MTKDYGHKVRFSPEHHILLKYGENLLKYPESVKKIGNGKLNLLGTLLSTEICKLEGIQVCKCESVKVC